MTQVSSSSVLARNAVEKPSINPFAKIIVPDAAKQKYVKPEIKIKNILLRSISDSLSASIKHVDTEIFCEHIEIKCFSM